MKKDYNNKINPNYLNSNNRVYFIIVFQLFKPSTKAKSKPNIIPVLGLLIPPNASSITFRAISTFSFSKIKNKVLLASRGSSKKIFSDSI